jgi:hypothetical protein
MHRAEDAVIKFENVLMRKFEMDLKDRFQIFKFSNKR